MTITLVLGGARSGKSRHAESLCEGERHYIATAQAFDEEMRARITKHQDDRGEGWITHEAPLGLIEALTAASGLGRSVLVDCLTLWLSNVMLAERDWQAECDVLVAALSTLPGDCIFVSNEVGMGLVPDNALGRAFRDAQGRLNQQVAAVADKVVFVAAGLPLTLKG